MRTVTPAAPAAESKSFLQAYFDYIWARRPKDVEFRASISIQTALSVLREQSQLTREQMATRLGVDNAKLAYLEARGTLSETQYLALIEAATEYSLPNLAQLFHSKLVLFRHTNIRGNKKRGRRAFNE